MACITALAIGFHYCWSLTLIVLAFFPISALFLSLLTLHSRQHIHDQEAELITASKQAVAAFQAIETVKCFNSQDIETRIYTNAISRAAVYAYRQARITASQIGFARFVSLLMFTAGFWYGSHLVITGRESTGNVITAIFSALTATGSLQSILPYINLIEKGKAAGAGLQSLVTLIDKDTSASSLEGSTLAGCNGHIEFIEVSVPIIVILISIFLIRSTPGRVLLS